MHLLIDRVDFAHVYVTHADATPYNQWHTQSGMWLAQIYAYQIARGFSTPPKTALYMHILVDS